MYIVILDGFFSGSYTNLEVGSVVRYICDEGFEMHETGEIFCELKNRWAGDLPKCDRVSCGPPPQIPHASIDGKDYKYGGTVIYKCDVGYEMTGVSRSTCQSDRIWSYATPKCLPISCDRLNLPDQGRVELTEVTYGSVAKYSCYAGYELQVSVSF